MKVEPNDKMRYDLVTKWWNEVNRLYYEEKDKEIQEIWNNLSPKKKSGK